MKTFSRHRLQCLLVLLASALSLQAKVRLPGVFSDHMVLQRDAAVAIWGWADAGEPVAVEFAGQRKTVIADAQGKWFLKLDSLSASAESRELIVSGKDSRVKVSDVLVGDVWLCSGQSNMAYSMNALKGTIYAGDLTNANLPLIRQGFVPHRPSVEPQDDAAVKWITCAPQTIGDFTAAGFYFAREVQKKIGVPIGLLNSSWGGTSAESWTSKAALDLAPEFKARAEEQIANLNQLPAQIKNFPAAIAAWEKENDRVDAENLGEKNGWHKSDVPAAGWKKMKVNARWRDIGLTNGGIVWLRKEMTLPAAAAKKDLRLFPGRVDEQYLTAYWNGGSFFEFGRQAPEFYFGYIYPTVPARLVQAGKNVLALRFVVNTGDKTPLGNPGIEYALQDLGAKFAGDDWLVKVEKEFPPLTPTALAARPASPKGDAAHTSSALFGGMIRPLAPFALKGALWYQGEQDAGRASVYRTLLSLMIYDWRACWGADFPFLIQQLPNWIAGNALGTDWAELREAQAVTARDVPNCGLSVAIDIGEAKDVHPKNKREIGRRLALVALAKVYGKPVEYCGPVYDSMTVEGSAIRLEFVFAKGLRSLNGLPLKHFVIAGADRKYFPASARIEGDTVVVSSPQVAEPVAVRYAFFNNPEGCNFSNISGLPAMPFRTDAKH